MDLFLNGRKVLFAEVEGVDFKDYPKFCDAYIAYAEFDNGIVLNDRQLDQLTEENYDFVHSECMEQMFGAADSVREYTSECG
jgi:hypothetical protein